MKKIALHIIIAIAFISCKKIESDLESAGNAVPIYKMQGTINDEPFNYTINDSTIFMTYGEGDMNGVATFYSEFENTENQSKLKISILAPEKKYQNYLNYNTEPRELSYLVHEAGCYEFGYTHSPIDPPVVIFEQNGNYMSTPTIELPGYGIYSVPVRFKGLSNETFNFTINHGFTPDYFSAKFTLSSNNTGIYFESENQEESHEWFLDEQKISDKYSDSYPVSDGLHTLIHIMSDKLGNSTMASHIFYAHANSVKWIFQAEKCGAEPTTSTNYDRLILSYVEDDETYTSSFSEENANHSFSIKNTEYFTEEYGSPILSIKFDVEFSGVMYNADKTKSKLLEGVVGTCKYIIQ